MGGWGAGKLIPLGGGRGWEMKEEQCWPLVKCLVLHKQAAYSYTLPEKPSLGSGLKKNKDLDHPAPKAAPTLVKENVTFNTDIFNKL